VVRKAARRSTRKRRARPRRRRNRAALKQRILSAIRGTGLKVWTVEMLMQATGCSDHTEVLTCAQELERDSYIGSGDDAPAARQEDGPHMSFDLPADWQPQDPISLSPAAKKVLNRAIAGVVTVVKPASAAQSQLTEELRKELLGDPWLPYEYKQIRQYATERFGDWRKISSKMIWETAQKDPDNPVGKGRSLITFERALGRRKPHWRP